MPTGFLLSIQNFMFINSMINCIYLVPYHLYRQQTKFTKLIVSQVSLCPQGACMAKREACMAKRGVRGERGMHGEGGNA